MSVMEIATWLTMLVLGPGSIAVFIWFLVDLKKMFSRETESEKTR